MNTFVLEQTEMGEVPVNVYQKLAGDRILFITDDITDDVATYIVATLLLKDAEDPNKKITLFINSHGGDIRNAFMIYDVMTMITAPVETVCIGMATDEAAIILAGGEKGNRLATKNAVIAISQLVHDWAQMTNLTDAKKLLEQSKIDNNRLIEVFSKSTGKTATQIKEDFDRRMFFTSNQAVAYGLIDHVIAPNKKVSK